MQPYRDRDENKTRTSVPHARLRTDKVGQKKCAPQKTHARKHTNTGCGRWWEWTQALDERVISGRMPKMCSYANCKRPHESSKFYRINLRCEAGGQDWTQLVGSMLCRSCYVQYSAKGTLERTMKEPLPASAKKCSYEGCKRSHENSRFYQIDGATKAGGRDWSELSGSVLCFICYNQFRKRGRLERTANEPLVGSARRCSYAGCKSPTESSRFNQIDGASIAGGQDWSELAGTVLCDACYLQYMKRGTLERTRSGQGRGESAFASSIPPRSSKKRKRHSDEAGKHAATRSSRSSSKRKPVEKEGDDVVKEEEQKEKEEGEEEEEEEKGEEKEEEEDVHKDRKEDNEEQAQQAYDGLFVLSSVLEKLTGRLTGKA